MKRLILITKILTFILLNLTVNGQSSNFDSNLHYSLLDSDLKFINNFWKLRNEDILNRIRKTENNNNFNVETYLVAANKIEEGREKILKNIDRIEQQLIQEFIALEKNIYELNEHENISITNKVLIENENIIQIKSLINEYKTLLIEYSAQQPLMIDEINIILNTNNFKENSEIIKWENSYFNNIPIGAALNNLEILKHKILMAENTFLIFLYAQF